MPLGWADENGACHKCRRHEQNSDELSGINFKQKCTLHILLYISEDGANKLYTSLRRFYMHETF